MTIYLLFSTSFPPRILSISNAVLYVLQTSHIDIQLYKLRQDKTQYNFTHIISAYSQCELLAMGCVQCSFNFYRTIQRKIERESQSLHKRPSNSSVSQNKKPVQHWLTQRQHLFVFDFVDQIDSSPELKSEKYSVCLAVLCAAAGD